jgi:hypothetical protein
VWCCCSQEATEHTQNDEVGRPLISIEKRGGRTDDEKSFEEICTNEVQVLLVMSGSGYYYTIIFLCGRYLVDLFSCKLLFDPFLKSH